MSDYRDRAEASTAWDRIKDTAERWANNSPLSNKKKYEYDEEKKRHESRIALDNYYLKALSGYEDKPSQQAHDDKIDIWKHKTKKRK